MIEQTLQDQVVLIIGAGRGPGPALAQAFAAQGAIIAANDLSPVLLDPLAQAVRTRQGRIQAYPGDATRGMPLRSLIDEVLGEFNRIDVLINNPRVQPEAALIDMDEWDWQRTIEMNLNGPFLAMRLVARLMQEQGKGVILNVVDGAGRNLEAPGRAAYAASQAGLLALSQAAAREFLTYNILVHALCPDEDLLHATSLTDSSLPDAAIRSFTDLAVFLCSPAAAHLTGQVFQTKGIHRPIDASEKADRS